MLGIDFLPFCGAEFERIEFTHLPFEFFTLGRERSGVGFELGKLSAYVLPPPPRRGDRGCGIFQLGISIEQPALRCAAHERLMFVLTMHIDQVLARFAQLRGGHAAAVDKSA